MITMVHARDDDGFKIAMKKITQSEGIWDLLNWQELESEVDTLLIASLMLQIILPPSSPKKNSALTLTSWNYICTAPFILQSLAPFLKASHYSSIAEDVSNCITVFLLNTTPVTGFIGQYPHRNSFSYSGPSDFDLLPTTNLVIFWSCSRTIINNCNSCITTNSNTPLHNHCLPSPNSTILWLHFKL